VRNEIDDITAVRKTIHGTLIRQTNTLLQD